MLVYNMHLPYQYYFSTENSNSFFLCVRDTHKILVYQAYVLRLLYIP